MRKLFGVLLLVVGLLVATTAVPAQAAGKPGKTTDVTFTVSAGYDVSGTVYLNPSKGECVNVTVFIGDGGPARVRAGKSVTADTATDVNGTNAGCTLAGSIGYSFTAADLAAGVGGPTLTQGEADVYVTVFTYYSRGYVSLWTEGPFTYSPTS
jgi:hypothetical protein